MNKLTDMELRKILLRLENPGRYAGGEFGAHNNRNFKETDLKMAVSYPDLYEIGMSNNAIKILYSILNSIDGVVCDRVFTPAPDLEKLLDSTSVPLFTLENRLLLNDLDILGFSFGYELTATNILNILKLGGIPLKTDEREDSHPIIIAGGPGVTNPLPYGDFIDLFFIGEAESEIAQLAEKASVLKKRGAGRKEILEMMRVNPHLWYRGKKEITTRAVYQNFSKKQSSFKNYPVPSVRAVQDNGVVEIMRGCPNGCRFCHAGYYYRPKREKPYDIIESEINDLVFGCGYREITLSSLSSGDYSSITSIIGKLNKKYSGLGVSFSFPSLKLSTFILPLLAEIGEVRKSGLTFAVESPDPFTQKSLNKEVEIEQTIEIIQQAKRSGWRVAKFYFMIGLPGTSDPNAESDKIIDFLFKVQGRTGININVNIGTFIPKPHTPYQWASQMEEEEALKQIHYMKNRLKGQNIKLGYQSPMMSFIEGIFSRGDERTGKLLHDAFNAGARLDAWEEHFSRDIWKSAIEKQNWDVASETYREKSLEEKLPWDNISLGVSKKYFKDEYKKSLAGELTERCEEVCGYKCGVCGNDVSVVEALDDSSDGPGQPDDVYTLASGTDRYRVIFSFTKKGSQIYLGHLDIMRLFEKAFQRSRLSIRFTEGFNPKPRLEFAHPLSLGIESDEEIASVETDREYESGFFIDQLNNVLPEGIALVNAVFQKINTGDRKLSLMSLYTGSRYRISYPVSKDFGMLVENYVAENSLSEFVQIENMPDAGLNESNYENFRITVKQGHGSRGLFKILKEATGLDNPLADIIAVREKILAESELTDYISFFS